LITVSPPLTPPPTTLRIKSHVPVSFLLFQITARSSPLYFVSLMMRGSNTTHDRTMRGRSTLDRSSQVKSMPPAPFSSLDRAPPYAPDAEEYPGCAPPEPPQIHGRARLFCSSNPSLPSSCLCRLTASSFFLCVGVGA
jgi:hypothetical protein